MNENKKRVPKIRFPGFNDSWEQRKLGETVKITMGQSPNSDNYTDNPDDHILVQGNADMKNGRVVPRVWTTQVTKQAEKHDLILSVRAPVGDIGITDYDVVLGRGVAAIKGNEFIYHSLERMKQNGYWIKLSTGSTFESINSNDIKDAHIMIPNEEEQSRIGDFFNNLDNLITLHQRKLNNVKKMKAGLLQKMFPKKGEYFPEIRFPGFTDAWEQRKLSSIVETIGTGKSKYKIQEQSAESPYEILGSTSVIGYDKKFDYEGEFILTARVGANAGTLYHRSGQVKITDNTVFIQSKNMNFIYYLLDHFGLKRLSFGTGQPLVKASELKKLTMTIPVSDLEHKKIGGFFSNIDNLITLHQRKIEHLQEQKKALLQQMFV